MVVGVGVVGVDVVVGHRGLALRTTRALGRVTWIASRALAIADGSTGPAAAAPVRRPAPGPGAAGLLRARRVAGRLGAGGEYVDTGPLLVAVTAPGWADGSTIASMRQSWPITSIAAWRRIWSLPPLRTSCARRR